VLRQHRVQVVDRAQVVAQLALADLHDERGRIRLVVAPRLELRPAGRRRQPPGIGLRSASGHRSATSA
jgi:hypothetical protein